MLTRPDIGTRHRAAAEVAHKGSGEVVGPVGIASRMLPNHTVPHTLLYPTQPYPPPNSGINVVVASLQVHKPHSPHMPCVILMGTPRAA